MKKRKSKRIKKIYIKAGSITVEAAYLVPMAAGMIALILGFIFFTYEKSAAKASAYETCLYGAQRSIKEISSDELMRRMYERIDEVTAGTCEFDYMISRKNSEIKAEISCEVMPEVFGDAFKYMDSLKIKVPDSMKIKRLSWLMKYSGGKEE